MGDNSWMTRLASVYKRHRFPPEIIQYAVWLYRSAFDVCTGHPWVARLNSRRSSYTVTGVGDTLDAYDVIVYRATFRSGGPTSGRRFLVQNLIGRNSIAH